MEQTTEQFPDLSAADSLEIAKKAVNVLFDKLAKDIRLIDAAKSTVLTDYYVVGYGRSATHCRALANELERVLTACGVSVRHPEGIEGGEWILVDLGGVIVHIFGKEAGEFYQFERLFREDAFLNVSQFLTEKDGSEEQ